MQRKTCRIFLLGLAALCAGGLAAARIEHSPVEALTQSGGAFPYTDARGGIWTASCCVEANEPTPEHLLGDAFSAWDGYRVGFRRNNAYPQIAVNPLPTDYVGADGVVLHPGELFLHPYSPEQCSNDGGRSRGVLTFTAPRHGFYTIRAQFRTLDKTAQGNSRAVDTSILIDGAVQHQEDIFHDAFRDGTPFAREHVFLKKGAKVQFVIGPGWSDLGRLGHSWNHACDATALRLELIEEDSERMPDDSVLGTASLNETLLRQTPETLSVGEVEDVSGLGTWRIYDSNWVTRDGHLDYCDKRRMDEVLPTSRGDRGVRFESTRSDTVYPRLQVVGTESPVGAVYPSDANKDPAYGCGRYAPYKVVQPHEIELHPGDHGKAGSCVAMRFVVRDSGVYAVTAKVRDLDCSGQKVDDGATGVYAWLYVNGLDADGFYVGADHSKLADAWAILKTGAVRLAAGSTVDLFIHPGNAYYSDTTGVFFDLVRLAEPVADPGWDAGLALRENALRGEARTNPFTSQGATWTIGWQRDQNGDGFVTAPDQHANEPYLVGFRDASQQYYKICGNIAPEPFTGNNGPENGEILYANEFFVHPMANNGAYPHAILRFTAPTTGVYSVDATFRDMSRQVGNDWWNTGVDCLVRAAGRYLASGVASIDEMSREQDRGPAYLTADRIYLQAGEPIDAMVGCRNAVWNDGTAVREVIRPAEPMEVVSVDFDVAGSATFAGRARVGFQSPKEWSRVLVSAQPAANGPRLRNDRGESTKVAVELTAPEGGALEPFTSANAAWPALIADGLQAASDATVYGWKVSGLEPGASYTLYLYGVDKAVFSVGDDETAYRISESCFFNALSGPAGLNGCDHVTVAATADAEGVIAGTFSATDEGAGVFCGLQIEGASFAPAPGGMLFIVR